MSRLLALGGLVAAALASLAALATVFGLLLPVAAHAQHVLTAKGGSPVIVWASETSAQSGTRLVEAGQRDLAAKYAACIVPTGTKVIIMPTGGYSTHRVTVIDGPKRGCEGNVYSRNILSGRGGETLADEQNARMARQEAELEAIRKCGDKQVAAIRAGRFDDSFKERDDCMTEHGFPRTKFDAEGKPVK